MKHAIALVALVALPLAATGQTPAPRNPSPGITATGKGVALAPVTTVLVRITARGVDDEGKFVAGLRTAGLQDPVPDQGSRPAGFAALTVRGRVTDATRAKTDAVAQAVSDYAKSHQPAMLVDVRFFGPADDCPAIEQRAREAALADARRRADALAKASGMRLGDELAVAESGGCPQVGPSGGAAPVDVSTMSMRILVEETVTFAIVK